MDTALNKKRISFKKSLGQNFIFDQNLLMAICADASVDKNDTVLEIGAGAGTLTRVLAQTADNVIAVEIDKDLSPYLNENLNQHKNVTLIFGDILKIPHKELLSLTNGEEFKIVANLPYYITTPVIFYFLESDLNIKSLTVMVQKEVADRITAKPNSKDYGALTLSIAARADTFVTRSVHRDMFTPAPSVDSAIVRMDIKRPFDPFLSKVIRSLFAMRRKTAVNNLTAAFTLTRTQAIKSLENAGISENARGQELDLNAVKKLAAQLSAAGCK